MKANLLMDSEMKKLSSAKINNGSLNDSQALVSQSIRGYSNNFKVSSQSRKFEFNVFSIIHLMAISFDVLDRF